MQPSKSIDVHVVLRMAMPGENVADEMSQWIQKCGRQFSVGGQDYEAALVPHDPRMPGDATQLTVTNSGNL